MEREKQPKNPMVKDIFHIFSHYLESSIPRDEWRAMSVEQVLQLVQDIEALGEKTMSPSAFSKKYRLPRTSTS